MAVKINLLPQDLSVGSGLNQVIKIVRAINVIALAVFIVFALGATGFFVVSKIQLSNINSTNDQITSQVKAEQSTEQKLVLLKDRVAKIKLASSSTNATKVIALASPLISALPANSSVNEATIDNAKISASIVFRSAADVSAFLQNIYSSKSFSQATLTSFGFNPSTGYLVSLSLTAK